MLFGLMLQVEVQMLNDCMAERGLTKQPAFLRRCCLLLMLLVLLKLLRLPRSNSCQDSLLPLTIRCKADTFSQWIACCYDRQRCGARQSWAGAHICSSCRTDCRPPACLGKPANGCRGCFRSLCSHASDDVQAELVIARNHLLNCSNVWGPPRS